MIQRFKFRKKRRPLRKIEIYVDRIEQIFNSMDPSPFQEKDLDHDAEEFIVNWAEEFHRHDPIAIRIHVNELSDDEEMPRLIEKAVRNYFSYRWNMNRLEFRRLMKQGRTSLLIGGAFLAACLFASDLLRQGHYGPVATIARESLIIAGWVAMWRPMQILLYEWWPLKGIGLIYRKLSQSPVELKKRAKVTPPITTIKASAVLRNVL